MWNQNGLVGGIITKVLGWGSGKHTKLFPSNLSGEKLHTEKHKHQQNKNSYNLQHPHPPIICLLVQPLDILNRQNTEFSYQYNILDNDQTSILWLIVITSFC